MTYAIIEWFTFKLITVIVILLLYYNRGLKCQPKFDSPTPMIETFCLNQKSEANFGLPSGSLTSDVREHRSY